MKKSKDEVVANLPTAGKRNAIRKGNRVLATEGQPDWPKVRRPDIRGKMIPCSSAQPSTLYFSNDGSAVVDASKRPYKE